MISSKWCNQELNANPVSWNNIKSELIEVAESKSLAELKDEISDVLYFTYCYLQLKTRINLPMIGAMSTVHKINTRLIVWQKIFTDNGLTFDKKYLVNGSNYARVIKVEKALELAKAEQCGG